MSAEQAKEAANEVLLKLKLPSDVPGQLLQLVTFLTEEECRFFYPRRALAWQQQVNTYVSRELRQRGLRVHRITLHRSDYETWRGNRPDSEELRREFADQHLRLVPKALDQLPGKR